MCFKLLIIMHTYKTHSIHEIKNKIESYKLNLICFRNSLKALQDWLYSTSKLTRQNIWKKKIIISFNYIILSTLKSNACHPLQNKLLYPPSSYITDKKKHHNFHLRKYFLNDSSPPTTYSATKSFKSTLHNLSIWQTTFVASSVTLELQSILAYYSTAVLVWCMQKDILF